MKLSYFPGCTLKNHARNFEDSILYSMRHLGVEVEELDRWNCCGTVLSLAADDLMRQLAPVRNLIRAKEANASRLMTACSMCYNTLKRANERVRNSPADLKRMNDFMYEETVKYDGEVDVLHPLELLRELGGLDAVTKKTVKPLKGLKVASYYGCLLTRPKSIAFDNVEDPPPRSTSWSKALGGTPSTTRTRPSAAAPTRRWTSRRSSPIGPTRSSAPSVDHGADVVIVSCPLCAFNLDHRQEPTLKLHPEFDGRSRGLLHPAHGRGLRLFRRRAAAGPPSHPSPPTAGGQGSCLRRRAMFFRKLKQANGTVIINKDWCKGCGYCVKYCPTNVLEISKDYNPKATIPRR